MSQDLSGIQQTTVHRIWCKLRWPFPYPRHFYTRLLRLCYMPLRQLLHPFPLPRNLNPQPVGTPTLFPLHACCRHPQSLLPALLLPWCPALCPCQLWTWSKVSASQLWHALGEFPSPTRDILTLSPCRTVPLDFFPGKGRKRNRLI